MEKYCGCIRPNQDKNDDKLVDDELKIFSADDLRFLLWLLGEKLKYGGDTVMEMRKYAKLYDKIEKELEENRIN